MKLKVKWSKGLEFAQSLWSVLTTAYRISPTIVLIKAGDMLVDSTLPVATAYLAGLTTTLLAAAFTGDAGAGEQALLLVLITALVALIEQGWGRVSDYIRFIASARIRNAVGQELYKKYLSLDFWRYEDKDTTDLKNRADRFGYRFEDGFDVVFGAASTFVTFVVALSAVSYSSPLIGAVILVALIPTAWVQYRTTKLDIAWWDAHRERNRMQYAYEAKLSDEYSVIDTRLFGLEHHLLHERQKVVEEKERAEKKHKATMLQWWVVSYLAENAALVFSLVYTVYQIASKLQSVGHFVFVQSMVLRGTSAMTSLIGRLGNMTETITYFKDYNEFMSLPTTVDGALPLSEKVTALSLSNVTFRYSQNAPNVLTDVSLDIGASEHVAIVGENGAGKTTLVRLIMGMRAPTAGAVMVNGINLSEYQLKTWHDRLGILFQNFDSYEFASVRDNVHYGRVDKKVTDEEIDTALKRARAYEFVQSLPKKEHTKTSTYFGSDTDSTRLSGGQWQRLAIARVFYREPEVLILDEPTSALDAKAEAEIFDEIHKEMKGKTVIIISHRFSTVRKAHKIVVLDGGKIKEMGTHEELMRLKGTYHTMFELQAKEYR